MWIIVAIYLTFYEVKQVNPKNIIIAYINVNSIRNKFYKIKMLLQLSLVHILIISETKLDSSFNAALFHVDKHKMYRQYNTAKSGGLLIYVYENIASTKGKLYVQEKHFECLSINVIIDKRKLLIIGAYKNPKLTDCECEKCFENMYDNVLLDDDVESILLGDLNFNMLNTNCILHELCDRYNLDQIVKDPTCRKSSNETLIDVILVSNRALFKKAFAKDIHVSDYHLLVGVVMRKFTPSPKLEYKYVRMYSKINYEQALERLRHKRLQDQINLCTNANNKYLAIKNSLTEIIDEFAPRKKVKVKRDRLPIMSRLLRKAILTRNFLRNR